MNSTTTQQLNNEAVSFIESGDHAAALQNLKTTLRRIRNSASQSIHSEELSPNKPGEEAASLRDGVVLPSSHSDDDGRLPFSLVEAGGHENQSFHTFFYNKPIRISSAFGRRPGESRAAPADTCARCAEPLTDVHPSSNRVSVSTRHSWLPAE